MPKKYTPELGARAVRMALKRQATEGGPRSQSIRAIAHRSHRPQVSMGEETLRMWCNRHGREVAQAPTSESMQEENKRLKRELTETCRVNEMIRDTTKPPGVSVEAPGGFPVGTCKPFPGRLTNGPRWAVCKTL